MTLSGWDGRPPAPPPPQPSEAPSFTAQRPRHSPPTATSRESAETAPQSGTPASSIFSSPIPSSGGLLHGCQPSSALIRGTPSPSSPRSVLSETVGPQRNPSVRRVSAGKVPEGGGLSTLSLPPSLAAPSASPLTILPDAQPTGVFYKVNSSAFSLPPNRLRALAGDHGLAVVKPDKLRDVLAVHAPDLLYARRQEQAQQDCHEFLRLLIDKMHEELRRLPLSAQEEPKLSILGAHDGISDDSCGLSVSTSGKSTQHPEEASQKNHQRVRSDCTLPQSRDHQRSRQSLCLGSCTALEAKRQRSGEVALQAPTNPGSSVWSNGHTGRNQAEPGEQETPPGQVSTQASLSPEHECAGGACTTSSRRSDCHPRGVDFGVDEPGQLCEANDTLVGEQARKQRQKQRSATDEWNQSGDRDVVATPLEELANVGERRAAKEGTVGERTSWEEGCETRARNSGQAREREEDRTGKTPKGAGGKDKPRREEQCYSGQAGMTDLEKTLETSLKKSSAWHGCRMTLCPEVSGSEQGKIEQPGRGEVRGKKNVGEWTNEGAEEGAGARQQTVASATDHTPLGQTEIGTSQESVMAGAVTSTLQMHSEERGQVIISLENLQEEAGEKELVETRTQAFGTGERCRRESNAGIALTLPSRPSLSQYHGAVRRGEGMEQKTESLPCARAQGSGMRADTGVPDFVALRELKTVQEGEEEHKVERKAHSLDSTASLPVSFTDREEVGKGETQGESKGDVAPWFSGRKAEDQEARKGRTYKEPNAGTMNTQSFVGAMGGPTAGHKEDRGGPDDEATKRATDRADTEWRAYMNEHETIMSQVFAGQVPDSCRIVVVFVLQPERCLFGVRESKDPAARTPEQRLPASGFVR